MCTNHNMQEVKTENRSNVMCFSLLSSNQCWMGCLCCYRDRIAKDEVTTNQNNWYHPPWLRGYIYIYIYSSDVVLYITLHVTSGSSISKPEWADSSTAQTQALSPNQAWHITTYDHVLVRNGWFTKPTFYHIRVFKILWRLRGHGILKTASIAVLKFLVPWAGNNLWGIHKDSTVQSVEMWARA